MRKINILAAIGYLCLSSIIMSKDVRTYNREKIRFVFKGGLNYSNIYESKTQGFGADPRLGFGGGVGVSIPLSKFFGVQPDLLFSKKRVQRGWDAFGK